MKLTIAVFAFLVWYGDHVSGAIDKEDKERENERFSHKDDESKPKYKSHIAKPTQFAFNSYHPRTAPTFQSSLAKEATLMYSPSYVTPYYQQPSSKNSQLVYSPSQSQQSYQTLPSKYSNLVYAPSQQTPAYQYPSSKDTKIIYAPSQNRPFYQLPESKQQKLIGSSLPYHPTYQTAASKQSKQVVYSPTQKRHSFASLPKGAKLHYSPTQLFPFSGQAMPYMQAGIYSPASLPFTQYPMTAAAPQSMPLTMAGSYGAALPAQGIALPQQSYPMQLMSSLNTPFSAQKVTLAGALNGGFGGMAMASPKSFSGMYSSLPLTAPSSNSASPFGFQTSVPIHQPPPATFDPYLLHAKPASFALQNKYKPKPAKPLKETLTEKPVTTKAEEQTEAPVHIEQAQPQVTEIVIPEDEVERRIKADFDDERSGVEDDFYHKSKDAYFNMDEDDDETETETKADASAEDRSDAETQMEEISKPEEQAMYPQEKYRVPYYRFQDDWIYNTPTIYNSPAIYSHFGVPVVTENNENAVQNVAEEVQEQQKPEVAAETAKENAANQEVEKAKEETQNQRKEEATNNNEQETEQKVQEETQAQPKVEESETAKKNMTASESVRVDLSDDPDFEYNEAEVSTEFNWNWK